MSFHPLSKIKVARYKSIQASEVALRRINILIGSNGAGKSNWLSIFTFLQNVLAQNLQGFVAQHGMRSLLFQGENRVENLAVELTFGPHTYGFVLQPTQDHRLLFQKEYVGFQGPRGYKRLVVCGARESSWQSRAWRLLESPVTSFLAHPNGCVYHFHQPKVKAEQCIANHYALRSDAGNLVALLYHLQCFYPQHYREIVRTTQLIAPYIEDFVIRPFVRNSTLVSFQWKQKGCNELFDAAQLSDGTLRFLCWATLLLQPPRLQPAVIVMEEPELGLHPYALSILVEMVQQISQEKQVIFSTQSVEMINEFSLEDLIVVDRTEHGSVLQRLDPEKFRDWQEDVYSVGELWKMNLLGGRLSNKTQ